MPEVIFAIPGDLEAPSGGYGYDRRILALLPQMGIAIRQLQLPGSFPCPSEADLRTTATLLAAASENAVLMIDGLALGAMPESLLAQFRQRLVALVHHPLCLESGQTPDSAVRLRQSETAALALAQAVITTSHTTARILAAEFGVPDARITVAEPGTERAARAVGSAGDSADGRLRLLAVGSVVPRKAHDVLIQALAALPTRDWHLDIAGSTTFNPDHAASIAASIVGAGLAEQVTLHGTVSADGLEQLYHQADIFVLASRYEGYGMVLSEAMIRGLPIICTTGCAAAETFPADALCLVPPDNPVALRNALGDLIQAVDRRHAMANAAWQVGQSLPQWTDTASRIAQTLQEADASRNERLMSSVR